MKTQEVFNTIKKQFPEDGIELKVGKTGPIAKDDPEHGGDSFIVIPAARIVEVCELLKTLDSLAFDCLSDETCVDRKDNLEVVYQLFSYRHNHSVALKVILDRENPKVQTVEGIWPVANWLEREVYDLFGVNYTGHSDLRRIMMPDDWVGHPLRKDYKEEEEYHGISTSRPSLLQ